MILIPISEDEILKAKTIRDEFDGMKTYDKFKCSNNYIGILGEIVLDRYLTEQNISHTWIPFIKKEATFSKPDFLINNMSIDLKTTYSDVMWFQEPKFDIYIYAQVSPDNRFLLVKGLTTGILLQQYINNGLAKTVYRGTRVDYIISNEYMMDIELSYLQYLSVEEHKWNK